MATITKNTKSARRNTKPAARKPAAKAATQAKTKAAASDNKGSAIRILNPKYEFGRPGTVRNKNWQLAKQTKNTAAYAAAGGLRKYLPRWARAGVITY